MSEPVSSQLIELERLDFLSRWFPEISAEWKVSYSRRAGSDSLVWTFFLEGGSEKPRGYEESVRQRFRLWSASGLTGDVSLIEVNEPDLVLLAAEPWNGEPFPAFFSAAHWGKDAPYLTILLDVVRKLTSLAAQPRLLSAVSADDFFVYCRSGVHLEVGFSPVFSILRDEAPRSEFQIARQWVGTIAAFVAAGRDEWQKDFSQYDPLEAKAFRPILKELDRGKEKSLQECFADLESILLLELASTKVPAQKQRLVWGRQDLPGGPLSSLLLGALRASYPQKVPVQTGVSAARRFSSFLLHTENAEGDSKNSISLLLPEKWFESSMIDSANRRMSTLFLKAHPNLTRVRSILCEEGFTALTGDAGGIPLPAVMEVRQGLSPEEILRIARKVAGALSQFESAEFHLDLFSPWQIEIHPVDPERRMELFEHWVERDLSEWPAWDVKMRAERPPESFLPMQTGESWQMISNRLLAKPFPALVIWMLEWKRLDWAARKRMLSREPLSWDKNLNALFEATVEYFETGNMNHRDRFLELLEEGVARE
ncbi:MAG: hypothetical protein P1U87_04875 [Verrucomicrobiales bacterium]|nr:hypothetical protein [Verrucomicrobiales bacterium]